MRVFNADGDDIVEPLRRECLNAELDIVGLARCSVILTLGNVQIHAYYRIDFHIDARIYSWRGNVIDAPVWRLAGDVCNAIDLTGDCCIRISFASGDKIDLWTDEGQYESIIFHFPNRTEDRTATVMSVF